MPEPGRLDEIRARHQRDDQMRELAGFNLQKHTDRARLLDEVTRLTEERDRLAESLAIAGMDRVAQYERANDAWAEVARLTQRDHAHLTVHREIEQILGKVLGYPWFKDDQKNFPGATEADGVCVGEHVPETIAEAAASEIVRLRAEVDELTFKNDNGHSRKMSPTQWMGFWRERCYAAEAEAMKLRARITELENPTPRRLPVMPFRFHFGP